MITQTAMKKNILKTYEKATQAEIAEGKAWYQKANSACQGLSERHGVTLVKTVGVVSALSPNTRWGTNLGAADKLIHHWRTSPSLDGLTCAGYGQNKQKAWKILEIEDDTTSVQQTKEILRGPKVTNFMMCILGDPYAVCVDGHAFNIARGRRLILKDPRVNIRRKTYDYVARAYVNLAVDLSLCAFELQATTWVTWRRIHNV